MAASLHFAHDKDNTPEIELIQYGCRIGKKVYLELFCA